MSAACRIVYRFSICQYQSHLLFSDLRRVERSIAVSGRRTIVYEWLSGSEFLIRQVVPTATVIQAGIDDTVADILALLPGDARTFFFHLNCSVTTRFPRERDVLIASLHDLGIRLVNDKVTDVSKSAIQTCCRRAGLGVTLADRAGDPDERLIVKSNWNFAGASERTLTDAEREALGLGGGSRLIWDPYHYFVAPRGRIKEALWQDPDIVCERFVSNSTGQWYRAYLMDDRVALCRLSSEMDVKKVGESTLEATWFVDLSAGLASLPEGCPVAILRDVSTFRKAFGLDFGTVDVVVDEDLNPFIIDANTTPAYNHPVRGVAEHLRPVHL